ncbi:DinB family protein [Bacillus alkalicellulosilyticus]|uniref:DinB family protein n=1 Tax=Alkalihalobacterium alkalicellulosilyticum TaxID=1912214 RepID=UPI0009975584|nr:DinB family protein [Bacillus alkalicellulosilyticus]
MVFDQLKFARSKTLKLIEVTDDSLYDVIPEGFRNHIWWNVGHLYVIQEMIIFGGAGEAPNLAGDLSSFFGNGAKPESWNSQPPSVADLQLLLQEQTGRIKETFENRLDERLEKPLQIGELSLPTIRDLITFTLFHEGLHLETMKVYRRLLTKD